MLISDVMRVRQMMSTQCRRNTKAYERCREIEDIQGAGLNNHKDCAMMLA
jgi:hypothetical protein